MALLLLCTMVLLLAYIYFGYPLLMLTLAAVRPRPIRKHPFAPTVRNGRTDLDLLVGRRILPLEEPLRRFLTLAADLPSGTDVVRNIR